MLLYMQVLRNRLIMAESLPFSMNIATPWVATNTGEEQNKALLHPKQHWLKHCIAEHRDINSPNLPVVLPR